MSEEPAIQVAAIDYLGVVLRTSPEVNFPKLFRA
jgi:hypothetical protein